MLRFHLEDGTPIVGLRPFRFVVEAYVFFRVGEPTVNSKSKMLHFQQGPDWSTEFKKETCTSMATTVRRSDEPFG